VCVCMCVCVYVCVYVCVCVCVEGERHTGLSSWMNICLYICMYVRMHLCMYAPIFLHELSSRDSTWATNQPCIYVCMYVCIYVCMHLFSVTNSLVVTPHGPLSRDSQRAHGPPTGRHTGLSSCVYENVCMYVCMYVCMHLFSVTNSLDVTRRHGPPTIRHSRKNPATTPSVIRKGASKTDVFFWMYIVNTNHQTSRQNPVTTPPVTRKGALKNEYRVAKTHRTP